MISFTVQDMTCGHCVATITKAVAAADAQAQVKISLDTHRVDVDHTQLSADQLRRVIEDLGFTPEAQPAA